MMTSKAQGRPQGGFVSELGETIKNIVVIGLVVLLLRIFVFQPFTIPSASMEPTLVEGDYIVVSKFSYGYSRHSIPFSPPLIKGQILSRPPQRGDIVVFKTPHDNKTDLIKRVIGLPGDTIQMKNGLLYINGVQVPRKFLGVAPDDIGYDGYSVIADVARVQETLPGGKKIVTYDRGTDQPLDNTQPFLVPAGHYFMMGDNRDNSTDSRVPPEDGGVGFVPAENIEGKAQIILISWHKGASLLKPWTWLNLRTDRFFKLLH